MNFDENKNEKENTTENAPETPAENIPRYSTENTTENPTETNLTQPFEQLKHEKSSSRIASKFKSFISSITAGVIGSAMTLGFITFTDQTERNHDHEAFAEEVMDEQTNETKSITPTQVSAQSASLADIVEKSSKAIVGIVNIQDQPNFFGNGRQSVQNGTGSGIIFKKEGDTAFIVTNNHVIEGANEVEVSLHNGEKTQAKLVGRDALTDLAVLKIDAKHADSVITFGDSSKLRPGDPVLAIGNPLGLDLSRTVTQGIVSAVDRSIPVSTSAGEWELNVIQTDAAINPGNSGGALINTKGEVIGINSLKISENGVEGLGFAIPSNDLVPIVNEIIENGQVERPYMGVGLVDLDDIPHFYLPELPETVEGGTVVRNIDPYSEAAKAGIEVKDVIVAINGHKIKDSNDLRKYLYTELEVGVEVEIELYRDGKHKNLTLTLTSKEQGF